ncbi:MAG: hypothetical protein ACK4PK_11470 [Alphaproteobacteria bacterium]
MAVFCSYAVPRTAAAYDGLMSGSKTTDGYDGLLAPSQPAPRGNTRGTQEPPGYEGLIRGAVPQRPVENPGATSPVSPARPGTVATPPSATTSPVLRPQPVQTARPEIPMTPRPGRARVGNISSAQQLMLLARLNGVNLDFNSVINDRVKPSPALLGLPDPKQPRVNGMLPMELLAKTQIDRIMTSINHPALSNEQRQVNARNGYNQLLGYVDGIMTRRMVPDAMYKNAGLSDTFIAEEHEANERAMARFEEAFKILRPLQ